MKLIRRRQVCQVLIAVLGGPALLGADGAEEGPPP